MSMTSDQIIDRRKMRRKLSFWRIAAFLLLAGFIIALAAAGGAFRELSAKNRDHIARVEVAGLITDDRDLRKLVEKLRKNKSVKAVLLDISSPGGSTVGGEALYEAVRKLGADKPVVASVGSLAASAGYMLACATDHIVARRTSLVGSIGVYIQYGNVTELMDRLGVEVEVARSGPLKAEPSPFTETSDEARRMLERVVDNSYDWFVGLVAERRGFSQLEALKLADGSVFTGMQGLENGLIDAIGDEETARRWLIENRDISESLKFVKWESDSENLPGFAGSAAIEAFLARIVGTPLSNEAARTIEEFLNRRLFLDGLRSLMQS